MRGKVILGMPAISLALVGVVFATTVNDRGAVYSPIKATEPTYTLAATRGVDVTDGAGAIRSALGASINFSFSKYTKQNEYFGDLAKGGYIRNSDIIHAIRSIEIDFEGEVKIYHGYSDGYSVIFNESDVATYTTNGSYTLDLSDSLPNYFKIESTSESTTHINSFSVTYGCDHVPSAAPKFTIRVNKPTVGGGQDIRFGNKLWINTDTVSDAWRNYEMIEDGDTYYYTFENVNFGDYRSLGNHYGFSLILSSSSGESPDWNYKFDYDLGDSYFFSVFEGQDELFVEDTFNFTSQPIPAADPYTLKMNLEVRGSFGEGTLGEIKFVYRQSESEEFNWDTVFGTSPSPTYSASISGLDCTKTLQFKIYIWHKEPNSNSYVTPENAECFTYVPTMESNQTLTVTFTFPLSGDTTGILTEGEDDDPSTEMSYADQTVDIHRNSVKINPVFDGNSQPFSWEYSGENIRIDEEGNIIGLKAGTITTVTLTSLKGLTCSFDVTVPESNYDPTWTRDWSWNDENLGKDKTSVLEGWFDTPVESAVAGFDNNFMNGADISSVKALYDNGTKFFNTDGVEQSLFYILKDHGFNWVRTKIWVDPQTVNGKSYGGGESTLDNALWVAKEAKAAGMKVLLDFHYSDYWTHPGQQILPKAWAGVSNSTQLAGYVSNYTEDTLETFNENGCLPEMVQLGNEISSGSFLQSPGADSDAFGAGDHLGEPSYLTGRKNLSASISGTTMTAEGIENQNKYLNAAVNAVKNNFPSIETVIHWAKGGDRVATAGRINDFFNGITADYDYAAISFYPYYCFDSMSMASSVLTAVNTNMNAQGKKWFVAETSYPFSGYSYVYEDEMSVASAAINSWTIESDAEIEDINKKELTRIHEEARYGFNAAGQAHMIHDLTATVINAGGKGMFYWEPAWVPNKYVGWAGEGSACSWSNQGFFSYNGKAIENIKVFDQMRGN